MTRQPGLARKAEEILGSPVVATAPVAGGDISTATKLRLSDGRTALMKTLPQAPARFFEVEAAGLRWLGEAGACRTPEVFAVDHECLIMEWIEPARPTVEAADEFGTRLARMHAAGSQEFGAAHDGYIGRLPLPNTAAPTWAEFFATRRVLPYLKFARDRGAVSAEDAAPIEAVATRLGDLVPEESPARVHGDLWGGNVVWSAEGAAFVIDPAAHGGHRESDLAMLALFGLPHLSRVMEAYDAETPLASGWLERQGVHQLFPLLVHACLFGGGYGARASALAARFA